MVHTYSSVETKMDPVCTCSNPTPNLVSELLWKLNMLYFFGSCLFLCVLFFVVSRLFRKLKRVEEKPVSDNSIPQIKYDVFVSFRGEDIRDGFLSHLTEAFKSKQINAFVDDLLERGEEIWPSLVRAIEGSFISLIIFSQGYASSRWCLKELVKILECGEKYGRIVIPVFYRVELTHVRHQSLESYKNALAEHGRKYKTEVQVWRHALSKSANISGIESSKFQNDAELVKEIVNLVRTKFAEPLVNSKELVGITEKIADVESLICKRKEPKDICLIGIWGMDGIGKTTLAEVIFNKLQSEYEGCYFLANVREQSSNRGIISLKNDIFSELLADDVKINTLKSLPNDIVRRVGCLKVLIVLDDVNDSYHLQNLLGTLDNFGSGSRIIVTTRDKQVLNANRADEIYLLREFNFDQALELFNLVAFNQSDHQRQYDKLSKRMVKYAKGIPLILKVLAQRLHGKSKEIWESELYKLKKMPPTKVYDVMKLSYDDLDRKEQQFFLDLACFFLRSRRKVNVGNLKSLLKDVESDNSVVVGLERLKDKALITFSKDNFISMHDSLREMAWEIVRQESIKDPGSCSWLWDLDDICEALENDKGTKAIRSIQIQLPTIKKQKLSPHMFAKMNRLQFLEISGKYNDDLIDQLYILAEGLQFLTTELRFLRWFHYPLKSLPENFSFEQLVILKLQADNMEKLWDGVKNLLNLKELDLNSSQMLKELPDLSKATNLEKLLLRGCSMLTSVHTSIFSLSKLEELDLRHCKSLTKLGSNSRLCSLNYLNLNYCENLTEFSLISENMKSLRLGWTMVKTLPSSFGHQSKLKSLHLKGNDIERLPSAFINLTQLLHLDVSKSSKLQTLQELPPSLETLQAKSCTSLETLPELPKSRKTLDIEFCTSLQTLPKLLPSLETLHARSCTSLQTLPVSLGTLDVSFCTSLQTLPKFSLSLKTLMALECTSLQALPKFPLSLKTLNVKSCTSLQTLPELPLSLETLNVQFCTSLQTLPELPRSLKTLDVSSCTSLQTLPEPPQSFETLDVSTCTSLQTLPELPLSLNTLYVKSCTSLQTLPKLPPSLKTLNIKSCTSLQTLPEFPLSLKTLMASTCTSLQALPNFPLCLKTLDVKSCSSLQTLPELSPSLKTLDVQLCSSLQTLPKFPPCLRSLKVECNKTLQILPKLPSLLVILHVKWFALLKTLPELPSSLKTLRAQSCNSLQTLPKLPLFLKILDVKSCTSLQTLPEFPSSLKTLTASACTSLQALPKFPLSLKTLDVESCTSLQTLPELPPSLETLNVWACTSLQSLLEFPLSLKTLMALAYTSLQALPKFPLSLKTLNVKSCTSLQTLPELPPSLETLKVWSCTSLQTLPMLPPSLETLDVNLCCSLQNLPELPPSLKTLKAIDCKSLQILPELPSFLETLYVMWSSSLKTLPKLPSSLKTLEANHCKSLKTVLLFHSMVVELLKENMKRVLFWNCLNLDEHSLDAIRLNAQINVMKFANQHLTTPHHHLNEISNDNYPIHHFYQVVYVYPGSSVPEWLEYKTTKDYIIIYLSPPTAHWGFVFCFILGKYPKIEKVERFPVKISISNGECDGKKDNVRMCIDYKGWEIESDHVCVMYDKKCSSFLNRRAKIQARLKIEVTMEAQTYEGTHDALLQEVLKGFGVSPISTSTYKSFVQQMELRDSMSKFN